MIYFNKIFYYYKFTYKILFYEIFFSFKYKTLFEKKITGIHGYIPPIASPYYFLKIARNFLVKENIKTLIDIGSGTGRAVIFFSDIKKLKITGVEIDREAYDFCINKVNDNVKLVYGKYQEISLPIFDCYFLSDTLRDNDFYNLVNKIKQLSKSNNKTIFLIYINGYHMKDLQKESQVKTILLKYNSFKRGIGIFKFY